MSVPKGGEVAHRNGQVQEVSRVAGLGSTGQAQAPGLALAGAATTSGPVGAVPERRGREKGKAACTCDLAPLKQGTGKCRPTVLPTGISRALVSALQTQPEPKGREPTCCVHMIPPRLRACGNDSAPRLQGRPFLSL